VTKSARCVCRLDGFEEFRENLLLGNGVETGGRFVEYQNFRPARGARAADLILFLRRMKCHILSLSLNWNAFINSAQ